MTRRDIPQRRAFLDSSIHQLTDSPVLVMPGDRLIDDFTLVRDHASLDYFVVEVQQKPPLLSVPVSYDQVEHVC